MPEGRVGCEGAVVAVAVNVGWGKKVGETVQELQGREAQPGTAAGIVEEIIKRESFRRIWIRIKSQGSCHETFNILSDDFIYTCPFINGLCFKV